MGPRARLGASGTPGLHAGGLNSGGPRELLHTRWAGLDVHTETVVACARIATGREVTTEVRTFATTTSGVRTLADWLSTSGCPHVAMEATGGYWKPVWPSLAADFELVPAHAVPVRNVPGRKTDVPDAMWLAESLAHGLRRGRVVPPPAVQELRDLTRTRTQRVRERGQHVQRSEKILEDGNITRTTGLTDVRGTSGRRSREALIAGEAAPTGLAALGSPRVTATPAAGGEAVRGRLTPHHRFLLRAHLLPLDPLGERIASFEAQIGAARAPGRLAAERLVPIPGVSHTAAQVIVAEIGSDRPRFPGVRHRISWAGLCPRMDESAGQRRSTRVRKGAPWLKTVLVQCAGGATRAKGTDRQAPYRRLKSRPGPMKTIPAVAASIPTAADDMPRTGAVYRDLGPDHFDRRDRTKIARRLARRIRDLGFEGQLSAAA